TPGWRTASLGSGEAFRGRRPTGPPRSGATPGETPPDLPHSPASARRTEPRRSVAAGEHGRADLRLRARRPSHPATPRRSVAAGEHGRADLRLRARPPSHPATPRPSVAAPRGPRPAALPLPAPPSPPSHRTP